MNNKGQTLVFFIALLPFIFILFVFAIDLASLAGEKTKVSSVADESIEGLVEKNKNISEIESLVLKNDKEIKITSIDQSSICLKKEVKPIFAGVLGYDLFKIEICKEGYIENNKLTIIEKGK